jgi:HD-GYP domain-containing protein (c-di-GMP phosphodiesterase class II)
LNRQEQKQLGHHVAAGYVLLSYYLQDPCHPAAITARDHHERLDGSGYPRGIRLQDRFVEIVAVGDVFDALISRRPYRARSYSVRTALEVLTQQADRGALSEEAVHALIRLNRKDPPRLTECEFSRERRGTPPSGNQYRGALTCKLNEDDD